MNREADIEAIRQLKYRYFRLLDTKRLDDLANLMTADIKTFYDNGSMAFNSRDEIINYFRGIIGLDYLYHFHQGHHPEIEITSDTTAKGTWYFEDLVYDMNAKTRLDGAGIYTDRYRKENGEWKISHTGYRRVFEVIVPVKDVISARSGVADGLFRDGYELFKDV